MNDAITAPARLSRAETKENTHRALLDAAERVFLRLGYHGATLDVIAADAGFTKGAVYWHFASKEALFLELLAAGMKRNADEAKKILTLLGERPDRLDAELGAWFDRFDASSFVPLLTLEMELEARRIPSFAELLEQVIVQQQQTASRLFAQYFEIAGRTPPIPIDELTKTIIALSKAVAMARQTRHSATLTSARVVRILLGMPLEN